MTSRALLLVNLGTPDAPTPAAVRAYYRQFLSDPRVVDVHPVLRWLLLNLVILPTRPQKVAPLYQRIWTEQGSPLLAYSRELQARVQALAPDTEVLLAMRYGQPSLEAAFARIEALGLDEVTVLPLFPHEASATTGSVREAVSAVAARASRRVSVRVVDPFYGDEGFLEALSAHVQRSLPQGVQHVVFSYHGLPERQVRRAGEAQCLTSGCCDALTGRNAGCYRAQCFATTRLLAARLGLEDVSTTFQSRLGRDPWIEPATDGVLSHLVARGVTRVAVVTPGFVSDCLETLEELGIGAVEQFRQAGGELFVVPCLNADAGFAQALARLTQHPSRSPHA